MEDKTWVDVVFIMCVFALIGFLISTVSFLSMSDYQHCLNYCNKEDVIVSFTNYEKMTCLDKCIVLSESECEGVK